MSEQQIEVSSVERRAGWTPSRRIVVLLPVTLVLGTYFFWPKQGTRWPQKDAILAKQPDSLQVGVQQPESLTQENVVPTESSTIVAVSEESPRVVAASEVLGTWVLDGLIRRVIENRDDGTATIDVTFDYFTALRYGSNLKLNLEWTLKDNVLTHTIIDGSPGKGMKRLISDFGDKSYFKILSLTENEMHLVDFDTPPEEYHWKRVAEE